MPMTTDAHPPEAIMAAAAASWPSWHYDAGRSVYWHLCTHHLAYFIQTSAPAQGMIDLSSDNGEMLEYHGHPLCICERSLSRGPCQDEEYEVNAAPSGPVAENGSLLPSGWVEEFLIDCYLGGCFSTSGSEVAKKELCMDNGMSEDSALYGNHVVDVEASLDIQISNCDGKASCSKAALQEKEYDCCKKDQGFENPAEEDKSLLEAWQSQYGQVVRSKLDAQLCPQAINLWNWSTCSLKGSEGAICLRGQLAQTPSRLHPSSHNHKGFMKTTRVCEVNLDLVKVISGEIFRLRQPSLKYLSSVAVYDSSNPTKDWNFPRFSLNSVEDTEGHAECVSTNTATRPSCVRKPFVPNLNHQRYQHSDKRKIGPSAIPASLRALSSKEIALSEERAQKYRDRAKERREVHGVDAEYGMHNNKQELCSSPRNMNNEWEREPKRHLTAQHILEKMGWSEGEGLGRRKDGLKEPLNRTGNHGRAGIGWFP